MKTVRRTSGARGRRRTAASRWRSALRSPLDRVRQPARGRPPAQLTDDALETRRARRSRSTRSSPTSRTRTTTCVWETFGREDGGESVDLQRRVSHCGYFHLRPVARCSSATSSSRAASRRCSTRSWTRNGRSQQVPQRARYLAISSIYAGAGLSWMGSSAVRGRRSTRGR